jgi:hypothetical protein
VRSSELVKQKVALKKLIIQINGKCNDVSSSAKINKKVSLYSLYLQTIKSQYIYLSIEDSEVVLVFERNNTGIKKLSSFV